MQKVFRNEAWVVSEEREYYLKTLKNIRFHKTLERIDLPTTTLLFVSRLTDPMIRQHFEDSSRHFKTYNLYTDTIEYFSLHGENTNTLTQTSFIFLDWLDFFSRIKFLGLLISKFLTIPQNAHLKYRKSLYSLSNDQLAGIVADLYQTIGLTEFTKLNAIIAANDNKNVIFGVRFLCKVLNNKKLKRNLAAKNIHVPENYQTIYGLFDNEKSTLKYFFVGPFHELNRSLLNYLEKKTLAVMEKLRVKDLVRAKSSQGKRTLIIGRRILTRGHDVLNENSLIQSYDYKFDVDQKLLRKLLKSSLRSFRQAKFNALIIIESFPAQVSYLLSRDEELRDLLHGNEFALACVEPESKDIYTFEGEQFVLKSLHQEILCCVQS